ncbi:hypothetical protein Ancab_026153 [Ancistrocladus abbreviatus]
MEQQVKELQEEVKLELLANDGSQVIDLNTVDALKHLGVAHHFEQEIEEALECMYGIYDSYKDKDDLHHTSLRFCILRIHGFYVSSRLIMIYLGMGPVATEEACRWARKLPTAVRGAGLIFRLLDDVGG